MTINSLTTLSLLTFVTAAVGGCDAPEMSPEPLDPHSADYMPTEQPAEPKAVDDYFTLRRDLRRCAYPLCGGWFVESVNREPIECADGTESTECYVAELAYPRDFVPDDGDLVHGTLSEIELVGQTFDRLDVDFAYESALDESMSVGRYSLIYDTGAVCVTAPCPSTVQAMLNTGEVLTSPEFFFLGDDTEQDKALQKAFWAQYVAQTSQGGSGALVQGEVWDDSLFAIHSVFIPKAPYRPACVVEDVGQRTTAWSFNNEAKADAFASSLDGDVTMMSGPCHTQSPNLICTLDYRPVHGVINEDTEQCETFGNACQFRAAVITSAPKGSSASGEWIQGPCFAE